jgi:hypothetical protein
VCCARYRKIADLADREGESSKCPRRANASTYTRDSQAKLVLSRVDLIANEITCDAKDR